MYWLITYSQTVNGRDLSATTATDKNPGEWFADLCEENYETTNKLLFAVKITKDDFDRLQGEL